VLALLRVIAGARQEHPYAVSFGSREDDFDCFLDDSMGFVSSELRIILMTSSA